MGFGSVPGNFVAQKQLTIVAATLRLAGQVDKIPPATKCEKLWVCFFLIYFISKQLHAEPFEQTAELMGKGNPPT